MAALILGQVRITLVCVFFRVTKRKHIISVHFHARLPLWSLVQPLASKCQTCNQHALGKIVKFASGFSVDN